MVVGENIDMSDLNGNGTQYSWGRPGVENALADHVLNILALIGEDPAREGLQNTPRRVARAYAELFAGYHQDPAALFTQFESEGYDSMVIVKDIDFVSHCEHHIAPFSGVAHVGYIPNTKIVGLSKIARLVEIHARRLQVQERLTVDVADDMVKYLNPLGVMVVVEATHSCMSMRGVRKSGSTTITSAVRGVFLDPEKEARDEFLRLIRQ